MTYTTKTKQAYYKTKYFILDLYNGIKLAYRYKWQVCTVALCIVVGVQEWGAVIELPQTQAVTYIQEPTAYDIADIELNTYIDTIAQEIYAERTPVYKEQARQEAIQVVGNRLIDLTSISPHVDYNYMREVVASMVE